MDLAENRFGKTWKHFLEVLKVDNNCSFKKTIRYWIAFLPVVTSFLICLASPVNGDMRYMLPITASTILYVAFVNEIIYKEYKEF